MSITDQGVPEFAHAFRGYERTQVDAYVAQCREYMAQVEVRAAAAESALQQCRRELASSPTTAGVSQRLAAILQLAEEEADQIRARAQLEHEATTHRAASEAEQTITHANQHRDAIQREIDDLSSVREELVQRLLELLGQIHDATERYQGHPPGTSWAPPAVELFDAEAVEDDAAVSVEQVVADSDADTQAIVSSVQTTEHD
ncbi:MAG: DivIVA protein [Actinomycetota bacterium]|nr:DivIVA protein [Actinomycetota bacterium]